MQYYYSDDGANQQGPCTLEQLKAASISAGTLVWCEGMPTWTPAGQVPELAGLFQSGPGPVSNEASNGTSAGESHELAVVGEPAHVPPPASAGGTYVGYQQQAAVQTNNGFAVASMVLGIVGIVVGCVMIPSILAIVFGHMARAQIRRGEGAGDGFALTGLILGYIVVGLSLAVVVLYVVMAVFMVGAAVASKP